MGWRHLFHLRQVQPDAPVEETFEGLQALVRGAQRRRAGVLGRRSDRLLFERLSKRQDPHSFVICCSDSRVSPPAVFHAPPGSLFTHENVGNQVLVGTATDAEQLPTQGAPTDASMLAGLQFAILALKVRHIVVLGHTQCGAMAGALAPDSLELQDVKAWLGGTHALRARLEKHFPHVSDSQAQALAASQENVLMQMERLHRHPLVQDKVARKELGVFGFVYELADYGVLSGWDAAKKRFVPINARRSSLPVRKA